jgi:hypothetical protein
MIRKKNILLFYFIHYNLKIKKKKYKKIEYTNRLLLIKFILKLL